MAETPPETPMRVPKHGKGQLRVGGTNKGGTGRPPDEFKAMCQELASSAETLKSARAILKNPKHPAWTGALKWATENGYGKPKESLEHTFPDLPPDERTNRLASILTTARGRKVASNGNGKHP